MSGLRVSGVLLQVTVMTQPEPDDEHETESNAKEGFGFGLGFAGVALPETQSESPWSLNAATRMS